ncbi:hypothetical protein Taro_051899 [Colocasia esculenta]|uniref:Uncharacterized protein n=1 Tax=Colocasia esculenta TaxID=4460 RepID=A0A843XI69_COLES|nr:hypothetical protein [Colocasia esculenta]
MAKHEPKNTMPPHGIDYWFMTPVSNPDNTAQELPLSLAVTDISRTTTLPESEGVKENDKTLTVPLHQDISPEHT